MVAVCFQTRKQEVCAGLKEAWERSTLPETDTQVLLDPSLPKNNKIKAYFRGGFFQTQEWKEVEHLFRKSQTLGYHISWVEKRIRLLFGWWLYLSTQLARSDVLCHWFRISLKGLTSTPLMFQIWRMRLKLYERYAFSLPFIIGFTSPL